MAKQPEKIKLIRLMIEGQYGHEARAHKPESDFAVAEQQRD